jgi:hypothetical protein
MCDFEKCKGEKDDCAQAYRDVAPSRWRRVPKDQRDDQHGRGSKVDWDQASGSDCAMNVGERYPEPRTSGNAEEHSSAKARPKPGIRPSQSKYRTRGERSDDQQCTDRGFDDDFSPEDLLHDVISDAH